MNINDSKRKVAFTNKCCTKMQMAFKLLLKVSERNMSRTTYEDSKYSTVYLCSHGECSPKCQLFIILPIHSVFLSTVGTWYFGEIDCVCVCFPIDPALW